jgi:hypothetical protein
MDDEPSWARNYTRTAPLSRALLLGFRRISRGIGQPGLLAVIPPTAAAPINCRTTSSCTSHAARSSAGSTYSSRPGASLLVMKRPSATTRRWLLAVQGSCPWLPCVRLHCWLLEPPSTARASPPRQNPGIPVAIPPTVTYGPSGTGTGTGTFTARPASQRHS